MRQACLWLVPIFIALSSGLEADFLPRRKNLVSGYLNKVLDSLFIRLTAEKLSVPEINLNETGKFTDVEISVPGKAEKLVDGVQSYGFQLDTNLTKIVISGGYDILHLDVPGLFPFFGKGNFCIILDMVNLNMKLTAVFNAASDKFDIAIPDFQVLMENSKVKFENLMNDTYLADFLNELLSKLLPDVVKVISEPLIKEAKPLIDYYGNGIIKCIKNGILTGTTEKCIKDLFMTGPTGAMGNEPKLLLALTKLFNFRR